MVWQSWKKTFQYQDVTAITGTKEIGFIVYNNETYIETIKCEEERWHKETSLFLAKFYFDLIASGF